MKCFEFPKEYAFQITIWEATSVDESFSGDDVANNLLTTFLSTCNVHYRGHISTEINKNQLK